MSTHVIKICEIEIALSCLSDGIPHPQLRPTKLTVILHPSAKSILLVTLPGMFDWLYECLLAVLLQQAVLTA